jgi:MFS family permease
LTATVATPDDARAREVHRVTLGAVFQATFFVRFAFGITLAVFATYLAGHETGGLTSGDTALVGLVTAMASVGEFSTVLVSGVVADRIGRFPVLFGGMVSAAVLFALVAFTRNPFALGAINFFFGISSGAILAATLAVVADRSWTDERGFEMGRFDAMNLAGWLGGYAFGIAILGTVSVSLLGYTFLAGAGILVAGFAVAYLLVRSIPRVRPARGQSPGTILRQAFRRSVLLVTLPWLVIYMLIGYVLVFFGSAAKSTGLPLLEIAAAIGGGGVLLVLSQPQFGRLADRYGRLRMMIIGVIGFVGVMLFASLLLAYGALDPLIGGLAVCALMALAYGPAALAALADLSTTLSRATTMAIYSLTISLGMILGLVGATQLQTRLGNEGLYVFFGLVAAALVVLTLIRLADLRAVPVVTTPAQ